MFLISLFFFSSKATTAGSSTATLVEAEGSPPTLNTQPSTLKPPSVQGRSSPPTLYTQTKPTQTTALPKPIPLPALGHSPDIKSKDPAVVQTLKEEKAVKQIEDKVTSDDSPPCSQTKWEAIGNESAEDLWGDDEFFEDDGILMDTIEVEIASSQVASSTPVRRVNKRLSLKGRTGTGVKKTGVLKPAENVQIAVSVAKTVISNASRLLTNSVPLDSAKKFVRATSANTIPNQTGSSYAGNTVTCSYQVVAKSETQTSAQISQSQKAFVPHKANCKSGFQPYKQSTSSVGNVNSQTTCVSQTTTVATYSLRSSNKMPHTTSRPQGVGSHLNVPKSASVTTGASQHVLNCPTSRQSTEVSRNCNTSSTSSSSGVTSVTSVASVTRTSPPSVTRVVYSTSTTSAITNPSRIIATARSQSSTFVPFKPGTQATQSIAPVTSQTSAAQSKPGNSVSTTSQNIGHGKASAATTNNPSASKIYVPYQKRDAQKKQSIPQKKVPPQSTREHKDSPSQQSKVYVPYRKQTCQDTTTVKPVPAGKTCKPPTSMTKVYVPYKKANQAQPSTTQTQCGKPSESGVVSSSQSLSKSSAFGKSTAQAVPSDSSNHPNVSSVNTTATLSSTQSQYNPAKQGANQTSTSSQISDSKSRSFVPFKKPGSTQSNQYKPAISSSSSQYKPSIPSSSSQYKPSIPNSSSQYKPTSPCSQNMNKSVVFGGTNSTVSRSQTGCTTKSSTVTAVTKSSTFVRHTGTALHISQPTSTSCSAQSLSRSTTSVPATKPHTFVRANTAQTSMPMKLHLSTSSATNKAQDSSMQNKASLNLAANRSNSTTANVQLCVSKNLAASHCSNNNVDLSKIFSPSKESSKSTASFSSVGATVTKSNPAVGSQMKSVGAGPDLKSTSVGEGGQFDDSLPDEMLMSVMDGSWDDEF